MDSAAVTSHDIDKTTTLDEIFEFPDDILVLDDGTLAMVPQDTNNVPPAVESCAIPSQRVLCHRLASTSTLVSLLVTCQVAVKLSDYLLNSCGYAFVMLTRINQDNIEVS